MQWSSVLEACDKRQLGCVMGILNCTPDSFSDGGRHQQLEAALQHAGLMQSQGADIIDVGGESTRPGAPAVAWQQELQRTQQVVKQLAGTTQAYLSIDTMKWQVAEAALQAGAHIINDVSGFECARMREVAAANACLVVVMHKKGSPADMQQQAHYHDVVSEVEQYLLAQAELLQQSGVSKQSICLDPGFGFAKTAEHNWQLFAALPRLRRHGYPLLVGASRKRMLAALLAEQTATQERLDLLSAGFSLQAVLQGADIVRVHDVASSVLNLRLAAAIRGAARG